MLLIEGEILPTIKVKVFNVNESWRSLVNLDYLKGGTPLALLERLAITFPRVVNDWLIFFNSRKWA